MKITEKRVPGYERVLFGEDKSIGYRGIIAVHSTVRGPALGGIRFWNYRDEDQALHDVLRLARGMTYKNALADLPAGGGKSVIFNHAGVGHRADIFHAHGEMIDAIAGLYIAAEDVGTGPADMNYVGQQTAFVVGLDAGSGDPSPSTACGVLRALQAAALERWGRSDLSGRTVVVQGCGHVGSYLANELRNLGADLVVSDIDSEKAERLSSKLGAKTVVAEEVYSVRADVFAPCALGGVLNDRTIPRLKVEIICGGANNQLLELRHGDILEEQHRTYVPDYAANAGGVINLCCSEILKWESARTRKKLDGIYDTVLEIFQLAKKERIPSYQAADKLAEARLKPKR